MRRTKRYLHKACCSKGVSHHCLPLAETQTFWENKREVSWVEGVDQEEEGIPCDWLGSTCDFLWLVQCWKQTKKKKESLWPSTRFWPSWAGAVAIQNYIAICGLVIVYLHFQYITAYSMHQYLCTHTHTRLVFNWWALFEKLWVEKSHISEHL